MQAFLLPSEEGICGKADIEVLIEYSVLLIGYGVLLIGYGILLIGYGVLLIKAISRVYDRLKGLDKYAILLSGGSII